MIEEDYVDAVIGMGKNLFYNSSMESCLLVCRNEKPDERKGRLFLLMQRKNLELTEQMHGWNLNT